jgi:hypothetical protein
LQRLGLHDQVVVACRASSGYQVHADRRRRSAVVRRGELVDDRRDTVRGVLRRLRILSRLGRDQNFYCDCHVSSLIARVTDTRRGREVWRGSYVSQSIANHAGSDALGPAVCESSG